MPVVTLNYLNNKIEDTYIDGGNLRNNDIYIVAAGSNRADEFGLIRFPYHLIPNNVIINKADLVLYSATNGTYKYGVHEVLGDWEEKTVTSTNEPSINPIPHIQVVSSPGVPLRFDVTNLVKKMFNDGFNYGFALKTDLTNNSGSIYSSNSTDNHFRPVLVIDYTIPTTNKKQVEYVTNSFSGTPIPSNTPTTIPYPEGTKEGDVVYLTTTAKENVFSIDGMTSLYTIPSRYDSLSGFWKRVGKENSITINIPVLVVNYNLSVFRNVLEVNYIPGSMRNVSGGANTFPNDVEGLPINSLILSTHFRESASTFSRTPLNITLLHSVNPSGYRITNLSTYNHSKTFYISNDFDLRYSNNADSNLALILVLTPVTNQTPSIDGKDEFLGPFPQPLMKSYNVADAEGDNVTITEKLNGQVISNKAGAGSHLLDLSAHWERLPLGKHTVSVEVNDDYNNPPHIPNVRTWTFIKILPTDAEDFQVVNGIGDVLTTVEGWKRQLSNKVNGNVNDKFEQLIGQVRGFSEGNVLSSSTTKAFPNQAGTNVNSNFISLDTSLLGFRPKHIIVIETAKTDTFINNWTDVNFYESGSDFANYTGKTATFRIPYVQGVVDLPVLRANFNYKFIAIGG